MDEFAESPETCEALLHQTYVDDVYTGADSIIDVLKLQSVLISKKMVKQHSRLFGRGTHWTSSELFAPFNIGVETGVKVLGLQWLPTDDFFCWALHLNAPITHIKRGILSFITRIFDPLGLFALAIFHGNVSCSVLGQRKSLEMNLFQLTYIMAGLRL